MRTRATSRTCAQVRLADRDGEADDCLERSHRHGQRLCVVPVLGLAPQLRVELRDEGGSFLGQLDVAAGIAAGARAGVSCGRFVVCGWGLDGLYNLIRFDGQG